MTVQSHFSAFRGVQLRNLSLAPENVRKAPSDAGIPGLAHSIEIQGVLENLIGYPMDSEPEACDEIRIAVVAGGRRWCALQLLLTQGKITDDYIVPCCVTTIEAAIAISLAENSDREPLHPADEYEAARALVDAGASIEDVAARLRLEPLAVKRRLKLANVAPEFISLYREGTLHLEHLMALALTDEHEKQRAAWKALPVHNRTASAIRAALVESEISSHDSVAQFVGLKAYEKAGGAVRRDLFSDEGDVYFQEPALLNQLATAKLQKHARKLQKENSLAWVEVCLRIDYADRAAYGRVQVTQRQPTEAERTQIQELESELEQLRSNDDSPESDTEESSASAEREREIEQALEALDAALRVIDPEQQAKAGALVHIGWGGKLCVDAGLVKPEDAKLFAAQVSESSTLPVAPKGVHSAALLQRFTALRTQALMAEFAQNPQVALAAVVHRLLINTFSDDHRADSPLGIITPPTRLQQFNRELESTAAHQWLADQRQHLEALLPADPKSWFQWITEQPLQVQLALLAFCASRTLDAVSKHRGAFKGRRPRNIAADGPAQMVETDRRRLSGQSQETGRAERGDRSRLTRSSRPPRETQTGRACL